jgi:raffinose/stachyose/melibiose transport system substrate-binding protein
LAINSKSQNIGICKQIFEYWLDGESDLWKAYADNGRFIVTYGYGTDAVEPLFQPFMDCYNEGRASYWCNQAWPAGTENEMEAKLGEYIGGQGVTVSDITAAMQAKFEELAAE